MGFLYQIEQSLAEKKAVVDAAKAGEREVELEADKKALDGVLKTMGIAVPGSIHKRLSALQNKNDPKRKALKNIALMAIEAGLPKLEQQYGD